MVEGRGYHIDEEDIGIDVAHCQQLSVNLNLESLGKTFLLKHYEAN